MAARAGRGRYYPFGSVVRAAPRAPMPRTFSTQLKYHCTQTLDIVTSEVPVFFLMNANSLYSPEYAGAGHQPMGFDQLAAIYTAYCVTSSKIIVTFTINQPTYFVQPYRCGITSAGEDVTTNDVDVATEQHNTKSLAISNVPTTITHTFFPQRDFAVRNPLDDDTLTALTGANPSKLWIFNVWCAPTGTPVTDVIADITVVYNATFTEPKELSLS